MTLIRLFVLTLLSIAMNANAQELPFREVSDYPKKYTAGTTAARTIEGLGFRYYWATDSLRDEDLSYKPSEDGRTILETLHHIYEMSFMIKNATLKEVNVLPDTVDFDMMRKITLANLEVAHAKLMSVDDMSDMNVIFEGKNRRVEYPFWHLLNGPIADCTWHVGQIVAFRRANGNPIATGISFFNGTAKP
ncbi:DinB family protein [Fulvivirga lutea]|uniref:DinB family protein n=1 Tax=Fulvivirga lutea TaxID=2810512 RepID=A0A974WFH7_9BACT|nr:hypothetical protein [Fulvivirga lutea]QSE96062.1 hypothetical protein JR347_10585 [Fulvivirga lutea]